MNPFDLPGPSFLLFYIVLGVVVLGGARLLVKSGESGAPPPQLSDPYQIAWLRGGTPEAARIAVLSLIDRGLIAIDNGHLRLDPPLAPDPDGKGQSARLSRFATYPPIERAILESAAASMPSATAVFTDPAVIRACEAYQTQLEAMGLVPDARAYQQRLQWCGVAATVMFGVGFIKIVVALDRGHSNIIFLLLLMLGVAVYVVRLFRRRRTGLGDRLLSDLRTLFAALKARASNLRAGAMTSDAVLLAAVFGLGALPKAEFATVQQTYRKAANTAGGGCGSSCGSGCGGGGCGGGCGGCGS